MSAGKMSSALKHELASHIYQYLCHEAQHSDLPEAARESLTAASECIEQAYKLNVNNQQTPGNANTNLNNLNNNPTTNHKQPSDNVGGSKSSNPNSSVILPDELLRIFTRHKEYLLSQQSETQERGSSSSSQHPISQLPMTTRKKLSHLRAQIKRQASKAARSRLEKRSSVSGTGSSSGDRGGSGHHFGLSLDAGNVKHQTNDGHHDSAQHHHHHHHHEEMHHQPNSASSTDSPTAIAFATNNTTSTPVGALINQPGSTSSSGNQQDPTNSSLSPGGQQQQNESGAGSSGNQPAGGKHGSSSGHLAVPRAGHHRHKEFGVSVHQKNFKQKLIALLKKFRTDGSGFDSEEQYREALERELMKAAAGRGSRAIEELLEEEIDVEEESGSELEDWDNISESSTPKPSLRPFFSSTTLDKI